MRITRLAVAIALSTVCVTAYSWAESSNRGEVRASLERDNWRVAWGDMFTEGDWLEGTLSVVASIYSENPGPFIAYMKQVAQQNYNRIVAQVPDLLLADLENWMKQSVETGKVITYRNLAIDAGFATYRRWQKWTHPSLDTSHWPWRYRDVTDTTALPNWHQFFVYTYRLNPTSSSGQVVRRPIRGFRCPLGKHPQSPALESTCPGGDVLL